MDMFVSAAVAAVMAVKPSFTARAYLRVRKVVIVLQPYNIARQATARYPMTLKILNRVRVKKNIKRETQKCKKKIVRTIY